MNLDAAASQEHAVSWAWSSMCILVFHSQTKENPDAQRWKSEARECDPPITHVFLNGRQKYEEE